MKNKILLVDEDRHALASIAALLSKEGYQVVSLNDAAELHEQIEAERPDLVIMEIIHQAIDGRMLSDQIKTRSSAQLPVILLTGLSYQDISIIDCQADAILGKPYLPENLLLTISNLLG